MLGKAWIRKISVVRDKEMKNRPICILDYWSQTALKPFHDSVMKFLGTLPEDFTNQNKDFVTHLRKGSGPYHSFDLTARTDRFPLDFQVRVVSAMIGKEKRMAWKHILVNYPFRTPKGDEIFFRRGQPLGAYSSWAVFSLCHHLILQYVKGCHPETNYRILGDDVVIRGRPGARLYSRIMAQLHVDISPMKTHVSDDTYEFMKR